eukprot:5170719-Amphidinium_carterae.3
MSENQVRSQGGHSCQLALAGAYLCANLLKVQEDARSEWVTLPVCLLQTLEERASPSSWTTHLPIHLSLELDDAA